MEGEIINRVANSKLKTIDLEDYYPKGQRVLFDIKDWLYEGIVVKRKSGKLTLSLNDSKKSVHMQKLKFRPTYQK